METEVESTGKRWWRKYSPEFKQGAVDRLIKGESATGIATELGIRRKFLYAWKDAGWGTNGIRRDRPPFEKADPRQQQIARQQQKIAELERLTGQQAAELDFFAAALRNVKETRPNKDVISGLGSSARSNR